MTTSSTPTILAQSDNYIWATTMLKAAGLPTTTNNVNNVVRWMAAEEPPANWYDRNNPLNASLGTSSTDGTGSYPSLTVAAQETAAMLRQSNMSAIYNALAANAPLATFSAAVVSSPWASSHYGGNPNYLTGIAQPSTVLAGGDSNTGTVTNAGGTQVAPAGNDAGGVGCSGGGIDILGAHIFTNCQRKALVGGLLIGAGGFVMLIGTVLIATYGLGHTAAGQAVAKSIPVAGNAVAAVTRTSGLPKGERPSSESSPAPAAPQTQAEKAQAYRDAHPDEMAAARKKRQAAGLAA